MDFAQSNNRPDESSESKENHSAKEPEDQHPDNEEDQGETKAEPTPRADKDKPDPQASSSSTPTGGESDPVITCTGLTKTYRSWFRTESTTAVNSVDLGIYPGEIFGLLGPNGSGKTTLMKLFLGLLFPDEGEAQVLGRRPDHVAIKERIGFLPEDSYLYDFLTGEETLRFYASLFGIRGEKQTQLTHQLLKDVGLWEDRDRKLSEYSKGMARRIGFAQAILNDPDVIFLDEPTVGLDPIIARQLKDRMVQLKEEGKTLIVSSHVLADVEDICDRVAILHNGHKRKEGKIENLLQIREKFQVLASADKANGKGPGDLRELLESHGWNVEDLTHPNRTLEELFLTTIEESTP